MSPRTAALIQNNDNPEWGEKEKEFVQKIERLEADLQRRQENYVQQKRMMQNEIAELQEELRAIREANVSQFGEPEQLKEIRVLHGQVLENIEKVQGRTVKILKEQEKDLLRAFRARLFDVQAELVKEKNKSDEGSSQWIEKVRQLEKELEWTREMADRLERVNQGLTKDNARLATRCKTQEDDRELLVKRLVTAKKEAARFEQELEKVKNELDTEKAKRPYTSSSYNDGFNNSMNSAMMGAGGANGANGEAPNDASINYMAEAKYKSVIKRLKRLLEQERRNVRSLKQQYADELQARTELEIFLRKCIDDVKNEISERRGELLESKGIYRTPLNTDGSVLSPDIKLADFTPGDRQRVMELLLSQERVIGILYDKVFPQELPQEKPSGYDSRGSVELPDIHLRPDSH